MAAAFIAERPLSGSTRPEWGRGVRVLPAMSWLLIYQPLNDGARILRALHGARDVTAVPGVASLSNPDESQ